MSPVIHEAVVTAARRRLAPVATRAWPDDQYGLTVTNVRLIPAVAHTAI